MARLSCLLRSFWTTSQACKVLERIIRKNIVKHLEENDLLSKHQHGFTPGKSCLSNLLETFNEWTQILDQGLGLDVVYLDYRKAFDSVPHKRLIAKVSAYGIKGKILTWLEDFLSDRMQQVSINNSQSNWGEVISGVPQGSVLGPTLFLLYVNELPTLVQSSFKMFADDSKMYMAIQDQDDTQILQHDIDTLEQWSNKWLLKFNASKCKVMHLGFSNLNVQYTMCLDNVNLPLKETMEERDLGVIVSNTLKPTVHCQKAASKAMTALKLLKIAFNYIDQRNFKTLYSAFVRPHLDYCVQAVGPYMVQDYSALEKVQRRATKMVQGLRNVPYEDRLRVLKLPSIRDRVQRGDLIETFKIVTGKTRLDATQFFERNQDDRTRGHHLKLKTLRSVHQARAKFFANQVVTHWNGLPDDVVSAGTTNEFKNRLDRHWAAMNLNQS